ALTVFNPYTIMTVTVSLTNNLADRVNFDITQGLSGTNHPVNFDLRNNLFLNGTVALSYFNTTNNVWGIYDNLFDGVALSLSSSATNIAPQNSNNGYRNTTTLPASSGGDVILANVDYQSGPLGNYYYPDSGTNLFSLVNGPTWTGSTLDGALTFDGVNDYVSCPISSVYDFDATNNFSIALWIKADPTQPASNGFPGLIRKDRGSGISYLLGIRSSDGVL